MTTSKPYSHSGEKGNKMSTSPDTEPKPAIKYVDEDGYKDAPKATSPTDNTEELIEGYIKVRLDYAPTTNGKKFKEWCEAHGFTYIGVGRRAWCSSLGTYFRDALGVAYNDGEPFLFYEDDVVDIDALASQREIDVLEKTQRDFTHGESSEAFDEGRKYEQFLNKQILTELAKKQGNIL